MLVIAAIAISLYLIKPILLPFVVAGIVAYVCTPLLDWLAARTRLPRALFAVLLFLLLIGTWCLTGAVAGKYLIAETATDAARFAGNAGTAFAGEPTAESRFNFSDSRSVRKWFTSCLTGRATGSPIPATWHC